MTHSNPSGDQDAATRRPSAGKAVQLFSLVPAPSRRFSLNAFSIVAIAAVSLAAVAPAVAQRTADPAQASPRHRSRDEILVTGKRAGSPCAAKPAPRAIDYACLNQGLKTAATSARPAPPMIDAIARDATTPSKAGTFSFSATSQRMGSNLGKSAQPYRPPAPAYTNPVRGAPAK